MVRYFQSDEDYIHTNYATEIISDDCCKQKTLKVYLSKNKERDLLNHSLTPSQTFDFQIMLNYPVLTVKQENETYGNT